jgi:hypothetical protein
LDLAARIRAASSLDGLDDPKLGDMVGLVKSGFSVRGDAEIELIRGLRQGGVG